MNSDEIDAFEKVNSQLEGIHNEIGVLSKNKPGDALSLFKLKFANQILEEANKLLGDKYRPFSSFNLFDEDDVPTNSDVTLIIGQYLVCMEKLRADNIHFDNVYLGGKYTVVWYWNETMERTYPPVKIKDK